VTRREVDDNGDFTYDAVITPARDGTLFLMRIVNAAGYAVSDFETVLLSFHDAK
jgi:hypothetical protein